jgi:hypothetical protein
MHIFISIGLLFLSTLASAEETPARKIQCSDIQELLQKEYFSPDTNKYRNRDDALLVLALIEHSLNLRQDLCEMELRIYLHLEALLQPQDSALMTEGEHARLKRVSLQTVEQLLNSRPGPTLLRLLMSLGILRTLSERYELGLELIQKQNRLIQELQRESSNLVSQTGKVPSDEWIAIEIRNAQPYITKVRRILNESRKKAL